MHKLIFTGYGDLNQNRITVTNKVRRSADYELVVGRALRSEDKDDLDEHVRRSKKAHGSANTIPVLNQIDVSKFCISLLTHSNH